MSLAPYTEYEDSGIGSLGNVPAHWRVVRLKHMATIQNGRDYKDVEAEMGGYPVFGSGGEFARATGYLHNGESVLLGRKGTIDRPLYINGPFWTADTMFYTVVSPTTSAKYLYYCALTIRFDLYSTNTALPSMTQADLSGIHFAVPCLAEQQAIVAFLDTETSKIDALVSEQEKLIGLLAEKRQATISHAVTKGLNPNAPMKDSGVEWLGKVPEHWAINRIKHLTATFEQGWSPQCEGYPVESESEWGVLKVGCVNGGVFRSEQNKALPIELDALPNLSINKGDLLISRANTRELVGSAAVPLQDYPNLMLCDKLFRARFAPETCEPKFVAHFLGTGMARSQIELAASGASSSMVNIGQSTILELEVAVPALAEQQQIVKFLDEETECLDKLAVQAKRGIALLQERRSALISAAVTGKIDVRQAVQQEQITIQEAA